MKFDISLIGHSIFRLQTRDITFRGIDMVLVESTNNERLSYDAQTKGTCFGRLLLKTHRSERACLLVEHADEEGRELGAMSCGSAVRCAENDEVG